MKRYQVKVQLLIKASIKDHKDFKMCLIDKRNRTRSRRMVRVNTKLWILQSIYERSKRKVQALQTLLQIGIRVIKKNHVRINLRQIRTKQSLKKSFLNGTQWVISPDNLKRDFKNQLKLNEIFQKRSNSNLPLPPKRLNQNGKLLLIMAKFSKNDLKPPSLLLEEHLNE